MSKKEFLKLLQDTEVQKAIKAIITPEVSSEQASQITNEVLANVNKILMSGDRLPIA